MKVRNNHRYMRRCVPRVMVRIGFETSEGICGWISKRQRHEETGRARELEHSAGERKRNTGNRKKPG